MSFSLGRRKAAVVGERRSDAHRPDPARADTVARLLGLGLVDAGFLGAQTGEAYAGVDEAAEAFVGGGWAGKVSPHPLVALAAFSDVVGPWRRRGAEAMLDHLTSERGLMQAWGPVFDPRDVAAGTTSLEARLAAVRRFLVDLGPDTPLPAAAGRRSCTYGEVRHASVRTAELVVAQERLGRVPLLAEWNQEAEAGRLAAHEDLEPPSGLVSVLMLTKDRVDDVEAAVRSVQAQEHPSWELLIADRGSDDGTLSIVHELTASDPRIRLVEATGLGTGAAHALALEKATGSHVAFLDPGARWRPHFLRTMLRTMAAEQWRVAHACARLTGEQPARYLAVPTSHEQLQVGARVNTNVLVVDAALLGEAGGFAPEIRGWDDHDLLLRIAAKERPRLVRFVGADAPGRGTGLVDDESDHWEWVALGRSLVDWDVLASAADRRVAGRVSVVMPVFRDYTMTLDAVGALDRHTTGRDLEIVVVDNASEPEVSVALASGLAAYPAVRLVRQPRNYNFALGSNLGVAHSSGEHVLFLNNDACVRAGWLEPLLERIVDPEVRGVQPLLVYPDETIQAAGTVFLAPGAMPVHALAGHPAEDAVVAADLDFSVVTAAALLMRASEVIELRGFDPIFVNGSEDIDLCLRAVDRFGGAFAVEPRSVVEHRESRTPGRGLRIPENRRLFLDRWRERLPAPDLRLYERNGFAVAHVRPDGSPYPAAVPVVVRPRVPEAGDGPPRLRWGVKSPVPGGPEGAESDENAVVTRLAHDLRARGQEVVTYRRPAHGAPASAFDDVVLGVRATQPVTHQPGKVNVLWVTGPASTVTPDELRPFDLVYAASPEIARRLAEPTLHRAGIDVAVGSVDALVAEVIAVAGTRSRPAT